MTMSIAMQKPTSATAKEIAHKGGNFSCVHITSDDGVVSILLGVGEARIIADAFNDVFAARKAGGET